MSSGVCLLILFFYIEESGDILLTGKERSQLKSQANTIRPTVIIGKNGLTENVFKDIEQQLTANELVKINVLEASGVEAKDIVDELLEGTGAEFVSQLGSKIVLYRESEEEQ